MKTYDLYGFPVISLEAARVAVERALSAKFVAHENLYHAGKYYRLKTVGDEELILQKNFGVLEDEWAEEEHRDIPILLYVNETERPSALEHVLTSEILELVLLRRESVD